jgi:hypothetical protein
LQVIGEGVFCASGLFEVDLRRTSIRVLGYRAFLWCSQLRSLHLPSTVECIGSRCFEWTALEMARLQHCYLLKEVGDRAFACCEPLSELSLSVIVDRLGWVLWDFISLEVVVLALPRVWVMGNDLACGEAWVKCLRMRSAERLRGAVRQWTNVEIAQSGAAPIPFTCWPKLIIASPLPPMP